MANVFDRISSAIADAQKKYDPIGYKAVQGMHKLEDKLVMEAARPLKGTKAGKWVFDEAQANYGDTARAMSKRGQAAAVIGAAYGGGAALGASGSSTGAGLGATEAAAAGAGAAGAGAAAGTAAGAGAGASQVITITGPSLAAGGGGGTLGAAAGAAGAGAAASQGSGDGDFNWRDIADQVRTPGSSNQASASDARRSQLQARAAQLRQEIASLRQQVQLQRYTSSQSDGGYV